MRGLLAASRAGYRRRIKYNRIYSVNTLALTGPEATQAARSFRRSLPLKLFSRTESAV